MSPSSGANKFLLPIMSQEVVPFMAKLGDELESGGYDVEYIPQNEELTLRDCKRTFGPDVLFLDHIEAQPQSSFEGLLEKYGIESPRSLVFPQMVYDYAYTSVEHDTFVTGAREVDYKPYLNLLHQALCSIDTLFENGNGGIPIQRQGGEVLRRVLQRVADTHGVKSVWVGFSPVQDHCGIYGGENVEWESFSSSFEVEMDEDDEQRAREYIRKFRDERRVLGKGESQSSVSIGRVFSRTLGQIKRLAAPATERRRKKVHRWAKARGRRFEKKFRHEIATRRYATKRSPSIDLEKRRYVFFPLQYFRESRVTVRGSEYYDIGWVVEFVSRNLPVDCELIVKDHPKQSGTLPLDTLRGINHHATILHPSINAHEVIRKAEAIITINNTVGFEAAMHGKPVVVLGSAFYDGTDATWDIDDVSEVPDTVRRAVRANDLSEEQVVRFAHRTLSGSSPGIWNNLDDENIEDICLSIIRYIWNEDEM